MSLLDDYRDVVPKGTIDFLKCLAEQVKGKRVLHINSTRLGGGVAEILRSLLPLLQDIGMDARWEVISGTEEFFATTKAFHNALQGQEQNIPQRLLQNYIEVNRENARRLSFDADYVIIHDPQPAALIEKKSPQGKWIWRCHIDISRPQWRVWSFLRQFVVKYNAAIFSLPRFAQRLPIPQFLIYPSIDPLSDKNRELSEHRARPNSEAAKHPFGEAHLAPGLSVRSLQRSPGRDSGLSPREKTSRRTAGFGRRRGHRRS